jgi:uncharacterized membrane protein YphA (DoxX/SURF4 family)
MPGVIGFDKRRAFLLASRLVLAAIFLYFGYLKVRPVYGMSWTPGSIKLSLLTFAMSVDAYGILPHTAALEAGKILPPVEIVLGFWLLSGIGLRYSSLLALILLAGFLSAITWAYLHGLIIPCGCGDNQVVGPRKIAEDGLMVALAAGMVCAAWFRKRFVT